MAVITTEPQGGGRYEDTETHREHRFTWGLKLIGMEGRVRFCYSKVLKAPWIKLSQWPHVQLYRQFWDTRTSYSHLWSTSWGACSTQILIPTSWERGELRLRNLTSAQAQSLLLIRSTFSVAMPRESLRFLTPSSKTTQLLCENWTLGPPHQLVRLGGQMCFSFTDMTTKGSQSFPIWAPLLTRAFNLLKKAVDRQLKSLIHSGNHINNHDQNYKAIW